MCDLPLETLNFLSNDQVRNIAHDYGTPIYVYDQKTIINFAKDVMNFPNAFGLTARYAMKACPNIAVLKTLIGQGLHIDASSEFEVQRALKAGIPGEKIQLTAQEIPSSFETIIKEGVIYNACSLEQLKQYGQANPGSKISIRINPGLGSGSTQRTNVGGPSSSFGIWYEYVDEVFELAKEFNLTIFKMHTHIGSGSDPEVWKKVALMSLEYAEKFATVEALNLGGGFKVARMQSEVATNLQACGEPIKQAFKEFAEKTGRQIKLEIEPGTYLAANSGTVLFTINDIVDTGDKGFNFIKIDGGMTEITRPSLYGAQQPMIVVPQNEEKRNEKEYIVAGHCCESGDIFTPADGDPESLLPRKLSEAKKGDILAVEGSGAYCAGMSTKNYNSFPEAAELMLASDGTSHIVRKRQTVDQILQNEVCPNIF